MKRYKATTLKYKDVDKTEIEAFYKIKIEAFYNTDEYILLKKAYDSAVITANESAVETKDLEVEFLKKDVELVSIARENLNKLKPPTLLIEDSIVDCPQIGERVLWIEGYKETNLLDKDLIKLSEPFFIDDGKKYIPVTIDNYKEIDKVNIISVKTDKYDIEEVKEVITKDIRL